MAEFTPMMQQYFKIKEQYKDAILFYRLGDFYEMFFEDAKTAARELELVLTGRDCGQAERAPMCGIPYHACEGYIARLVQKGYKVAICEQTEDPSLAKGIVTRDVIRVVTPGTLTQAVMLDETKNNYLACIYLSGKKAGLGFCDISTGECTVAYAEGEHFDDKVLNILARFAPSEILSNGTVVQNRRISAYIQKSGRIMASVLDDESFAYAKCVITAEKQFSKSVSELTIDNKPECVCALGCMLSYVADTQKCDLCNVSHLTVYSDEKYLSLNATTRRNLELTESERRREKKGSLLWVLDKTKTAMGKRKLRAWVEQPLIGIAGILYRQNAVAELYAKLTLRNELTEHLTGVSDLERIITRVAYGTANAKELKTLQQTLCLLPQIKSGLGGVSSKMLKDIAARIDNLQDICSLIESAITPEPPFSVREGGMIQKGYHEELDMLREIVSGGKDFLAKIEAGEQEKTGIKKLKIGYNRVFGYYIEVLNTFRDMVPETYIRKQTLSNCERYITPELKDLEAKVLGAQERIAKLEYELFCEVREKVAEAQPRIRVTADALAALDVLCSLAQVASENDYACPNVNLSGIIHIKDGRHPVVEKFSDAPFVPNDTFLDTERNRTAIITGPNMAGKSTYMRQTAVIVIMAQMGSFVPAKSAEIGIVDSIFTRVGASDDLVAGQSTFMTEMTEVAAILANATKNSLIVLDEIGRGTSTFDGMSIARAVLEYVTDRKKIGAKTLFATHYHELTALEGEIEGVQNLSTSVKKRGEDITFLRRIVKGAADGSYGIEVAGLSGVPKSVVSRARVILKELEEQSSALELTPKAKTPAKQEPEKTQGVPDLFSYAHNGVLEELKALDVNTLTPIEALTKLYELKNKLL